MKQLIHAKQIATIKTKNKTKHETAGCASVCYFLSLLHLQVGSDNVHGVHEMLLLLKVDQSELFNRS